MTGLIQLVVLPAQADPYDRLVDAESLIIGRGSSSDVVVVDASLSRRHARIFRSGDDLMLEDLGSRNGTVLNNRRVGAPTPLAFGDEIRLSHSRILVRDAETGPDEPEEDTGPGTVLTRLVVGEHDTWEKVEGEAQLRRYAERLRTVNEVHRALARSVSTEEMLELVLDRVFQHLEPDEGVIFLEAPDGSFGCAALRRAPGAPTEYLYSRTLLREVATERTAVLVHDVRSDGRFATAQSILDAGVRSLLAAPLLNPETCLGVMAVSSRIEVRRFSQEDLELLTALASVAALRLWTLSLLEEAVERRRLDQEVALAREIQLALLPDELPRIPGLELYAGNTPSLGVSGDFYQITERAAGEEVTLLLADVSGKGLAASLLTATLEALTAVPIAQGLPVAQSLERVNALLSERTPPEKFATAFLAVLTPASGEVSFASAGHNPALVVRRGGEVERLARTGLPLGLMESTSYETGRCSLAVGDTLVLYTDGIVEARGADQQEYGLERLIRTCIAARGGSVAEVGKAIEQDLREFIGEAPLHDDYTLVLAGRRPG